jgi:hypothetical protein
MKVLAGVFSEEEEKTEVPPPMTREPQEVPGPHLQKTPGEDLQQLRAYEGPKLNSYDWVDRDKGVVRIPIDRAMELVVRKGLPTRTAQAGSRIESNGTQTVTELKAATDGQQP